jgi:RNA polymerase sigma-70 factor, ECF subfamily
MQSPFDHEPVAEADLLERLRRMDSATWSRVARQYRSGILQACLLRLRNQADAEDVCSEVFLRAVSQIARFRGDASFRAWLHTIAYNLCMTHLSTAARRRQVSFEELHDGRPTESAVSSHAPSVVRLIASAEARIAFSQAMAALDVALSDAFHLREIEGLSYGEIAKVSGVPVNTVKTRIFRARLQLRRLLVEHRA